MAETEDGGEKTEAPTPRRRQEAAEEGNVPRSQDLVAAALIVGSMMLLHSFGFDLVLALRGLMNEMLGRSSLTDLSTAGVAHGLLRSVAIAGRAMLPLFVGLPLVAILVNIVQVGFKFNPARLQPNLGAFNPLGGLSRMFNARSPVQHLMSVIKFMLIAGIAYSAVRDRIAPIISAQGLEFMQIFSLAGSVVYSVAIRVGVALLILSILDYAWQRYRFEQDLKMTKQEVKEEMRSMDGDPKTKLRRRQIAIQIARSKLKKVVPTADVVVTNPTEFAVALKYDSTTMHAPRVIAKGQGTIAARIRELAIEAGIPILERKPLARALFKLVEVGQEIPEQFYATVAEILAYVYELNGKTGRARAGSATLSER